MNHFERLNSARLVLTVLVLVVTINGLLFYRFQALLANPLFLLLAVWWAWVYTTWVANWFDPDRLPVRLMLVAVMLASLVMSVAIPDAFGERGLMFALAYVVIQVDFILEHVDNVDAVFALNNDELTLVPHAGYSLEKRDS